jgi:hypothetical protein
LTERTGSVDPAALPHGTGPLHDGCGKLCCVASSVCRLNVSGVLAAGPVILGGDRRLRRRNGVERRQLGTDRTALRAKAHALADEVEQQA